VRFTTARTTPSTKQAGVQDDGDAVSDLELVLVIWLLAGGHGKELYAQRRCVFKTLL
jgi:hypothetical protein